MTAYDPGAVRAYMGRLYAGVPGYFAVSRKPTDDDDRFDGAFATNLTTLDEVCAAVDRAEQLGSRGIYLRVATLPRRLDPGRRGGANDVHALPCLWLDVDYGEIGHKHDPGEHGCGRILPPDEQAARQIVETSGLPTPTLWVNSGGGLYPLWQIEQKGGPLLLGDADRPHLKALSELWQAAAGRAAERLGYCYGQGVGNLDRVLRVPGSVNRKAGLERPCRVVEDTGLIYTIEMLARAVAAIGVTQVPPAHAKSVVGGSGDGGSSSARRTFGGLLPDDSPNVFEALELASWADILEPADWQRVGGRTPSGVVEEWLRPGDPSSDVSAKVLEANPAVLVNWSTSSGLPAGAGQKLTKARVFAHLYHGGDESAAGQDLVAAGRGGGSDVAQGLPEEVLASIAGRVNTVTTTVATDPDSGEPIQLTPFDVTNQALAADALRLAVGRGPLSGMFRRGDEIVYTPREGEDGYVPLTHDSRHTDGPAQVRTVGADTLRGKVQFRYNVFKYAEKKDPVGGGKIQVPIPAVFPREAAVLVANAIDEAPNLRALRGVTHTPVMRADGSVLGTPGYDGGTRLLYLPEAGLDVPPVPDRPTSDQVQAAVELLNTMTAEFPFVTEHHRANYLGLLLTPVLREMVPPPYKLGVFTAPQPGSGKSLLAESVRAIHGGVFRIGQFDNDDHEWRKQVSTILDVTTGAVVVFDNVTGVVSSHVLAGLLTSPQWDDRRLGGNTMISRPNDRLWLMTGNNAQLGGDLIRRTLWVDIDPQCPDPQLRTGFRIPDFARWVQDNRGELLAALLTMARAWVVAGCPTSECAADSYGRWVETVRGILDFCGVPGTFDHPDSARQVIGQEDEEWRTFLDAVWEEFGATAWTARELLAKLDATAHLRDGANGAGFPQAPGKTIPADVLPAPLAEKVMRNGSPLAINKSLGRWLGNRDGRWVGGRTVRCLGGDRNGIKSYRVEEAAR